jgi:alkyl sulfatase BDS1-like metallo-beta-lactamase superfamily hydrolase
VFADAANAAARELLAQSFEQMGYQAESMLWRNMYLTGAMEARATPTGTPVSTVAFDMIAATPSPVLFDLLAIRIDPARAAGKDVAVAFVFPERNERVRVSLANSVLVHEAPGAGAVAATVTMPRAAFLAMLFAGQSPQALLHAGTLKVEGDPMALAGLMQSFDPAAQSPPFPIVTP